ncbi:uncharacterized protein G2W53_043813 [Senna tora]|uniref:Uncharacterized protein n=1 Tax=Senna tora TaxID=362788 RepID=A0A834SJD9_9FABA|nr:uncharacterized protein G2W53_043813 [Senna tora]
MSLESKRKLPAIERDDFSQRDLHTEASYPRVNNSNFTIVRILRVNECFSFVVRAIVTVSIKAIAAVTSTPDESRMLLRIFLDKILYHFRQANGSRFKIIGAVGPVLAKMLIISGDFIRCPGPSAEFQNKLRQDNVRWIPTTSRESVIAGASIQAAVSVEFSGDERERERIRTGRRQTTIFKEAKKERKGKMDGRTRLPRVNLRGKQPGEMVLQVGVAILGHEATLWDFYAREFGIPKIPSRNAKNQK